MVRCAAPMNPALDTISWLPTGAMTGAALGLGVLLAVIAAVRGVRQRAKRYVLLVFVFLGLGEWLSVIIQRAPRLMAKAPVVHELVADDVACMPLESPCDKTPLVLQYATPEIKDDALRCAVPASPTQRVATNKDGSLLLYEQRTAPRKHGRRKSKEAESETHWVLVKERKEADMRFSIDSTRARHPMGTCAVVRSPTDDEPLGMTVVGPSLSAPPSLRHHGWFIEVMIDMAVLAMLGALAVLYVQLRKAAEPQQV